MILDVGCGNYPKGNVNCDVNKALRKIDNFVLCDGQFLPFKTGSFEIVYSTHVIEHVDNPCLMTKELLRTSKNQIIIYTPHIFSYSSRGIPFFRRLTKFTYHKYAFTRGYWHILLKNFKHSIKLIPNPHNPPNTVYLKDRFWWLPFKSIEIRIVIEKKRNNN